ncbi:MAG: phosphoribosylformylglycinamidine synthase subunit PurS [bacterium]|nr:phosphoribosylformylglycinamidine synthase subunit PurS [bacterium]
MFKVNIYVTLKKSVLDPQGRAVQSALHSLGFKEVAEVRVGRFIQLQIEGKNKKEVQKQVDKMCHQLLSNPVIEDYKFDFEK